MSKIASLSSSESPREFLDAVYQHLGYYDGELLDTTSSPQAGSAEAEAWLEKGDWLSLAEKIDAEKVFFVKNDPVVVFCKLEDRDEQALLNIFRRTWCMARPQCLFVARPGELRVYSLNDSPARSTDEWEKIKPLDIIEQVAKVSEQLQAYRREQVESGQLFVEKNFGTLEQRADKQLISDLKAVRRALLIDPALKIRERFVHALIGRSIFVRYLEDRGVLTPEYFKHIAEDRSQVKWSTNWSIILETPDERDLTSDSAKRHYLRVLRDKDFTYALFNQLAEHFNGDMFPRDQGEEAAVSQTHLDLLRHFLLGEVDLSQPRLFLWAYDFEIIPIELISSIYEEFYHKSDEKDKGTHYTPSVLVEYVLTQLLTPERLATKPKILDFACGSAIFLVQAFRRIVRYQEHILRRSLKAKELRQILHEQITGIEINEEAIHVAAFSLYLALLHYQEPKDILAQIEQANGEKPLPYLIHDSQKLLNENHYSILFKANTFNLTHFEKAYVEDCLKRNIKFKGRIEYKRLLDTSEVLPLASKSYDVIVGNPPWGYLEGQEGTAELRASQAHALRWCKVFNWSIGDKEMSQAFIARATNLLKPNGECGLLVSAGILFKQMDKSQEFRQRWLSENILKKVVNFSHVRHVFFDQATSPFCFVQYKVGSYIQTDRVEYWAAKRTEIVEKIQAVVLSLPDLHRIRQSELANNEILWNVYSWGNHKDAALISALNLENSLDMLSSLRNWEKGQGYTPGTKEQRNWSSELKELEPKKFQRYGSINTDDLVPSPNTVYRQGATALYNGWRLLVKQGITQAGSVNGRIDARLENINYCFRTSLQGIKLDSAEDWERKVLIGILWSSLARYYLFMTAYSWQAWHNQLHFNLLMNLPVRFPRTLDLRQRIINTVEKLQSIEFSVSLLDHFIINSENAENEIRLLERELDEAIFELYDLSESEKELILDTCEIRLALFYRDKSALSRVEEPNLYEGAVKDLKVNKAKQTGIEGYLYTFLQMWNRELESVDGEFHWHIIRPSHIPMLAIIFTTQQKGQNIYTLQADNEHLWNQLLQSLNKTLRYSVDSRIYIDGMIRVVTDTNIFIIKRDEQWLWTRSLAYEDAEATLLQAMIAQKTMD